MTNAQKITRRELSKHVEKELRDQAKPLGWKISKGFLFREDDGWFVDVRPTIWLSERKSTFEFHLKPMEIDPVFGK